MPEELDQDTIKALSADTRVQLLQELNDHGKTPTYLADQVGKHKSTVVEHLAILQDADLVARHSEEGRKRVTYTLTKKGKQFTSSRGISLILAASAMLGVSGTAAVLWSQVGPGARYTAQTEALAAPQSAGGTAGMDSAAASVDPVLLAGLALLGLAAVGIGYWYLSRR